MQSATPTLPEHDEVEAALAALAHEVRTPLNGILALAELLAASALPERERGWAADLREAADHIAQLTTLTVDGARSRGRGLTLERQAFAPHAVASAIAQTLAVRAACKGLVATSTISPSLPPFVCGDRVRLRAVLENLIDNAVKFTSRGRISFTADAVAAEATANGAARMRLSFVVEDDGIGLSDAEIAHLFRPFAQANAAIAGRFGGSGLGLSLARNIARAMGGDLTVTSEAGRGSAFRLTVEFEVADAPPPDEDEMFDDAAFAALLRGD